GSSRIPLVAQLLHSELGARVAVDTHPKYAVSLGAAIAAAPRLPTAAPAPAPVTAPPRPTALDEPTVDLPVLTMPTMALPTVPNVRVPDPAVLQPIDLAGTGLTAPTDVKVYVPLPPPTARPRVT